MEANWEKVERSLSQAKSQLEQANTEELFQSIGLLCRETLITLAQTVYDPSLHITSDGVVPSSTDAKRMLEAHLQSILQGSTHEAARKFAKSALELSNDLQHRRTATFRDAAFCIEATNAVVRVIALISGHQGNALSSSLTIAAIKAIEGDKPNQAALCRQFMNWLIAEIDKLNPDFSKNNGKEHDDLFIEALNQSTALVVEFSRVTEAIATMKARESALSVYKSFGKLRTRYGKVPEFSGISQTSDFDFYKFLGHELFVVLFSFLIKEEQWELIDKLLDEKIYIENPSGTISNSVSFLDIPRRIELLGIRNQRLKLSRISLHADILNQRYSQGDLAIYISARQFMEADYFLFLCSIFRKSEHDKFGTWHAWSTMYMDNEAPRYLIEAKGLQYALQLLRPFGASDLVTLKAGLTNHAHEILHLFGDHHGSHYDPLMWFDIQEIGTK